VQELTDAGDDRLVTGVKPEWPVTGAA